jgi:hypothetical protein
LIYFIAVEMRLVKLTEMCKHSRAGRHSRRRIFFGFQHAKNFPPSVLIPNLEVSTMPFHSIEKLTQIQILTFKLRPIVVFFFLLLLLDCCSASSFLSLQISAVLELESVCIASCRAFLELVNGLYFGGEGEGR